MGISWNILKRWKLFIIISGEGCWLMEIPYLWFLPGFLVLLPVMWNLAKGVCFTLTFTIWLMLMCVALLLAPCSLPLSAFSFQSEHNLPHFHCLIIYQNVMYENTYFRSHKFWGKSNLLKNYFFEGEFFLIEWNILISLLLYILSLFPLI